MKLFEKFLAVAALGCLLMIVESCSTSSLVDVWKDPSYHESPLKKIFVIAIRKDQVQRRIWEDAFADELSKHGVKATSSYQLYPNALPDTNQIIQTVQDKGFDGILVTRLLNKESETHYVESYVTTKQGYRYNDYRKRYDLYSREIQHPGYVDSVIVDRRAIDVWVIRDEERIIWSATSNSPERKTIKAVQEDIAELVIPALKRNSIIKSEK